MQLVFRVHDAVAHALLGMLQYQFCPLYKTYLAQLVERKALNLIHAGSIPAKTLFYDLSLDLLCLLDPFLASQRPGSFKKGSGTT